MTRINLIPVEELTDQHLLAEHREIKRIPNVILSGKFSLIWQPKEYTLWTWHIKFFYDKIEFLRFRYIELYNECIKRWFNVERYYNSFNEVIYKYNKELCSIKYTPTQEAIKISRERIEEKIKAKPLFYKYYWKPLWKE